MHAQSQQQVTNRSDCKPCVYPVVLLFLVVRWLPLLVVLAQTQSFVHGSDLLVTVLCRFPVAYRYFWHREHLHF